jgi:hypothetical protein
MTFYQKHYPNELEGALNSSGNMHNPALGGIIKHFDEAFKSTELYSDFNQTLNLYGYRINSIDLEKFTIYSGKVSVAEIIIFCVKKHKKQR